MVSAQGKTITEGAVSIILPRQTEKISREQEVFYKPVMRLKRDLTVLMCKVERPGSFADPMCATGVRALRVIKEASVGKIRMNDISADAIALAKKNAEMNGISGDVSFSNDDANSFILASTGFDYIDIDPFGSPNPFLQSAILRASRGGMIAVTATDTAPLSGTFPMACQRNYWAKPLRTEIMHEAGLRILIRKVQLVATQFEKALVPVFSYSREHYFRIFFKVVKGKEACDKIIDKHSNLLFSTKTGESAFENRMRKDQIDRKYFDMSAGPMWSGEMIDEKTAIEMQSLAKDDANISSETKKLIDLIAGESRLSANIFVDLHQLVKRNKLELKKTDRIIDMIRSRGYSAVKSHFEDVSIRTDMPYCELLELFK